MKSLSDVRSGFLDFFAERRPHRGPVLAAGAAQRPHPAVHQCGHGPVQEPVHRRGKAPLQPRHHGAEMRPRRRQAQRPGQCRLHRPASHLLRDAGEFLLRRLFQGRRHHFAWDFVSKVVGLPKDKLLVTVYPTDDQARQLWKKIAGFSDDRIIGHESNLWAMGPTGPCGYCSEIFYDQGAVVAGGPPGSPGRRRRPFPGILEPGLHAVRAGGRKHPPGPAQALHRHRHGAGAHRRHPAGRHQQLRCGPVPPPDRGVGIGQRRGQQGRGHLQPPHHRRSSARHLFPDRRWRAAVQ